MRAALLVVRRILVTAVAGGAIRSNAADGVRKPRSDRQEMHFLTPEQVTLLADEISKPPVTRPRGRDRRHEYLTYGYSCASLRTPV